MGTSWITSDLHDGHKNIYRYEPSRVQHLGGSVEEMREGLIENINSCVMPEDTLYILGDISFHHKIGEVIEFVRRLNGTKHLIYGNHDGIIRKHHDVFVPKFFASAQDRLRFTIKTRLGKRLVIMDHYPIAAFEGIHHQNFHFYGHLHGHGRVFDCGHAMDVGIDGNAAFQPYRLDLLIEAFLQSEEAGEYTFKHDGLLSEV